ncbi:MAG: helix-hairpin-helix domain-containing protein [Bacilli bacterium]|nr:helix-hairpin-helix domain-containing protein [Bacilli bacterium]
MKTYQKYLIICGVFIIIILTFISYIYLDFDDYTYLAEETTTTATKSLFYVDVKGAVINPGVYEFKTGDRVFNAIEKAGGLSKNGNTSNINLSQKLASEMVVYIYTNNEIKSGSKNVNCDTKCNCEVLEVNNCYVEENKKETKININTGNLEELITLNGIGESKALAIIKHREENGYFTSIEELTNVTGIGLTIYEKLKGQITV